VQNLGGGFVVFFLGGKNRNFGKVRGLKLLLTLLFPHHNTNLNVIIHDNITCTHEISPILEDENGAGNGDNGTYPSLSHLYKN